MRTRHNARRVTTILGITLVLALSPTAAFAAGPATGAAGGTTLSIGSGVLLAVIVGLWAHRVRGIPLALTSFVAGVMLAGSAIALSAARAGDQFVAAGIGAVTGIFA